jgi:phage shock protein PspC (stress-responsive transcriptional regulator)
MSAQSSVPPSGGAPGDSPPGWSANSPVGSPPGGPSAPPGAEFFDRIRGLGVVRPDEGRWAAGVCAGLARRWGLDPLLVRGLFVAVSIAGGFGLALYGVLWLLLPHPDGRIHAQEVLRGVVTAGFVGAAIFTVVGLPLHNGAFGWRDGGFGVLGGLTSLALIGFGIWWFVTRGPGSHGNHPGGTGVAGSTGGQGASSYGSSTYPSPEFGSAGHGSAGYGSAGYGSAGYGYPASTAGQPTQQPWSPPASGSSAARRVDVHAPSHAVTRSTLGAALIAAAAVLLWGRFGPGLPGPSGLIATAVALGVIALGLIWAGLSGRRGGGLAPIAILLALIAAGGASANNAVNRDYGRQTWAPVSALVAGAGYRLGAGRAVLDLTQPALVAGATSASPITVPVEVGAGEVIVVVPSGAATEVTADVGLGDVTDKVGSQGDRGGAGVSMNVNSGSAPVMLVTARVGLGHIEIVLQGTQVQR